MHIISEDVAATAVTVADVIPLMEQAFQSLESGSVELLPVVIGKGFDENSVYGVKGGLVRDLRVYGFKFGSYMPSNPAKGLKGHGSTTVLLDPDTGFPMAMIGAKTLSAIRAAALDAIAIRRLARRDARTLAVIGAGNQAMWEVEAALASRSIELILIANRSMDKAIAFAAEMSQRHGVSAIAVSHERAVSSADIVITATASPIPVVETGWVRPGTHISAMGADIDGKQELQATLVKSATLYTDIIEQSVTIGEYQEAFERGVIKRSDITPIGTIIDRDFARVSDQEITLFESSGTALQDLVVAQVVLDAAIAKGLTIEIDVDV